MKSRRNPRVDGRVRGPSPDCPPVDSTIRPRPAPQDGQGQRFQQSLYSGQYRGIRVSATPVSSTCSCTLLSSRSPHLRLRLQLLRLLLLLLLSFSTQGTGSEAPCSAETEQRLHVRYTHNKPPPEQPHGTLALSGSQGSHTPTLAAFYFAISCNARHKRLLTCTLHVGLLKSLQQHCPLSLSKSWFGAFLWRRSK